MTIPDFLDVELTPSCLREGQRLSAGEGMSRMFFRVLAETITPLAKQKMLCILLHGSMTISDWYT